MKKILGVPQPKFHKPVMQRQHRFYLIKIDHIQKLSQKLKSKTNRHTEKITQNKNKDQSKQANNKNKIQQSQNHKFKIKFEIGTRSGQTGFVVQKQQPMTWTSNRNKNAKSKPKKKVQQNKNKQQDNGVASQNYRKRFDRAITDYKFDDVHIFPFEKQQVMSIKFQNVQYPDEYGYALVPLVPFIKIPQTKHQIQVQMVFQTEDKEVKNQVAAVLHINLYFLHNFKARLFVEPVVADLTRNLAEIGQMDPKIAFCLRQIVVKTEAAQQGGIKPHWQSKKQNQFSYFNLPLQSVFDDLYVYLHYNRQITMDEIIGKAQIDLQQEGIFKNGLRMNQFIALNYQYLQARQIKQQKLNRKQNAKNIYSKQSTKPTLNQVYLNLKKKQIDAHRQKQKQQIRKRTQTWIPKMLHTIINQENTINSNYPPKIIQIIVDKIYNQFLQNKPEEQRYLDSADLKDVMKYAEQDLQTLRTKLKQQAKLTYSQYLNQIRNLLLKQLQNFTLFVQNKMAQTQISLLYQPVNQQGQDLRQKQIGKFKLRYLFIYEFQFDP